MTRPARSNWIQKIGAALSGLSGLSWSGYGGRYGGVASGSGLRHPVLHYLLPGTGIDWERKAGDLWLTSAVAIFLNWIELSFMEAIPCLARLKPDGTLEYDHTHPLSALLRRPSREISSQSFWSGTVKSYACDGNGYWLKVRNRMLDIDSLRYAPHYMMEPRWPEDGSQFISHYERLVNGVWQPVDPRNVVHLRQGLDPRNERKGFSSLKAQVRQAATDNENSTYNATLTENFGMPGLLISADGETDVDPDEVEKFAKRLAGKTTGDKRFTPEVSPVSLKMDRMTLTPEEMALDKLMNQPAWRIGAALGIDPLVVGLPSENEGSYDNTEQAERKAWNNAIIPWMAMISADLTLQLLPDYGLCDELGRPMDGYMVAFDTRNVRALRINLETLLPVLVQAAGGPVLTPNEARGMANYDEMDGQDELREVPAPAANGPNGAPGGKGKNSDG